MFSQQNNGLSFQYSYGMIISVAADVNYNKDEQHHLSHDRCCVYWILQDTYNILMETLKLVWTN